MVDIDPDHLFDANFECVRAKNEMPSSLFQFMTNKCPAEIAVRLEMACDKLGATIKMNKEDNAIPISAGYESFVELPDESKYSKKEEVHFIVKQYVVGDVPKDLETRPLSQRDDVTYLVSLKRLRASPKAYSKIATKLFQMPCLSQAMQLDDVIGSDEEKGTKSNGYEDEQKS